jgi:hypothetical protein
MDNRLSYVLCTQGCMFLWIVHSWLPLRFSLMFIFFQQSVCVLCTQCCQCLFVYEHYQYSNAGDNNSYWNRHLDTGIRCHTEFVHYVSAKQRSYKGGGDAQSFLIATSVFSNVYIFSTVCLCLVYPMLPVSICLCLWIFHSWLSIRFSLMCT